MQRLVLLIPLISSFISGNSFAGSLYDFTLPNLQHERPVSLGDYHGKIVLVSFFEPDCRWCHRQMKAFNQLIRDCDASLQPVAVGVHGNKQQLRKELRKAKVKYPGLVATKEFVKSVGGVPATPWTLLLDPNGDIIYTFRGYITYKKLSELFGSECTDR